MFDIKQVMGILSGGLIVGLGVSIVGLMGVHYPLDSIVQKMGYLIMFIGGSNFIVRFHQKLTGQLHMFWGVFFLVGMIFAINYSVLNFTLLNVYISMLLLMFIVYMMTGCFTYFIHRKNNNKTVLISIILGVLSIVEIMLVLGRTTSFLSDDMRRLILLTYMLFMLGGDIMIISLFTKEELIGR